MVVQKQTPVAVLEKARDTMLGTQHGPLRRLWSMAEQCKLFQEHWAMCIEAVYRSRQEVSM